MRLLKFGTLDELSLTEDFIENIPRYAILSHTWGADNEEVTFDDLKNGSGKSKAGYAKIQFCIAQARKDGLQHVWVDTCCIDKANHTELAEAIVSMFRWYREAVKCYVYLSDVSVDSRDEIQTERTRGPAFRESRWFTRGWTLQELLAPKSVEFFSREGERLGDRNTLEQKIHEATEIPITALRGSPLSAFSVDERMRWAEKRTTKRIEDKAYCLLGIFNLFMSPIYGEGENAFVRLKDEITRSSRSQLDLDKIPYVKGAIFDARDTDHVTCHPATRVDLLDQIQNWARQPQSKSIFWLNGMAGTGKSTISMTVAQWLAGQGHLSEVDLGASFFFKRGEGDRGSASQFFSTITRQLVLKIPDLDSLIAKVTTADPFIFNKALGEQFDKLVYQPLQKITVTLRGCATLIVVVDALDECENERDIKTIIDLWSRLPLITTIKLRLFLTSRPDLPIRLGFKSISVDTYQDLVLQDAVPHTTIQQDITIYLKDGFLKIRENYNDDAPSGNLLDHNWPGEKVLEDLVGMAIPLFIVAATICRFVGDPNWDPREQLKTILKFQGTGHLEQMEQIYLPVLTQQPSTLSNSCDKEKLYQEFRMIVGSIVTLAEPLSTISLAALLNVSPATIVRRLRPLHSVLRVSADSETPVRTLHLSFREFLLSDKLRNEPIGVDGPTTHRNLLAKCLQLLSGPTGLHKNLCAMEYPGQLRREVSPTIVDKCFTPALQYACQYWVYHVQHCKVPINDEDEVHVFLQKHFLHWLEALSLLGRLTEAIEYVKVLKSLISSQDSIRVSAFLDDAWRFVLSNRFIGDLAPLQLYSSAIVFAPQKSIIRKICGHPPTWIQQYPVMPLTWSPELQKLEGHTGLILAVAFSPDGSFLASASYDRTIRLWNSRTGQEVQTLKGHTSGVYAVAFSPDGSLLASASGDGTVRLWNSRTGQDVQTLKGHTSEVYAVAFSPDGSLLASASWDETVRLWNSTTGQEVQTLKGHTSEVYAVAFSPDGSLLASASWDETVRLWNSTTGRKVQTLKGHTSEVYAVAFSPDGSLLASASLDKTVRLWNSTTGQEVQTLKGHTSGVSAVAFSPDGSLLASASWDETVRLWNSTTGRKVQTLKGHTSRVSAVAFSPDGSLLASASWDKTVRLWNSTTGLGTRTPREHTRWDNAVAGLTLRIWGPTTGRKVQTLKGHTSEVYAVAFSPDGSLLASASLDETVRLWRPVTGRKVQTLKGHTSGVYAVAFSPDGSLLASASWDETVRLWRPVTGRKVQTLKGHTSGVYAVAFSPDGSLLASASGDHTVRLWRPVTGRKVQTLKGHTSGVYAVAFSPDGSLLASASWDKTVQLWNSTTGQEVQTLKGHTSWVYAVAFSPDGSLLASASEDETVQLWDPRTGQKLQRLDGLPLIEKIDFAMDNRTLLTNRGYVRVDMSPASVKLSKSGGNNTLMLKHDWIEQGGRRILWLPHEYRSKVSAFYGNRLAIGQSSGVVSFLQIEHPPAHSS